MVISHKKINLNVDVEPLKAALEEHKDLFGELDWRRFEGSPHNQMRDIWVRYNSIANHDGNPDLSDFNKEHDSVWYDSAKKIPEVLSPVFDVMTKVQGERLGAVIITKLPPGGEILPHIDGGWHAGYYDKYYIPVKNGEGSSFYFEDGVIDSPDEGSVWAFENSNMHWVKNESNIDRIAMIVCIKTNNKFGE